MPGERPDMPPCATCGSVVPRRVHHADSACFDATIRALCALLFLRRFRSPPSSRLHGAPIGAAHPGSGHATAWIACRMPRVRLVGIVRSLPIPWCGTVSQVPLMPPPVRERGSAGLSRRPQLTIRKAVVLLRERQAESTASASSPGIAVVVSTSKS